MSGDAPRRRARLRSLAAVFLWMAAVACAGVEGPLPAARGEVQAGGLRRPALLAFGERVPEFAAPGLDGGIVRWRERAGSPTVLVVWAAWCPHCQRLLPVLARVAGEFSGVRLVTVTTSIGRRAGPSPSEFLERHGLSFPVARDDDANSLAQALGVYRYPAVYWVGRDGRVRGVSEGDAGEAALRTAFRRLLAETP